MRGSRAKISSSSACAASAAGSAGSNGWSFRSGRSSCGSCRSRSRSSGPCTRYTSSGSDLRVARSGFAGCASGISCIDLQAHRAAEAPLPHPFFDGLEQVVASSSLIATSASRVTWNGCDSTISMPGNRAAVGRDHLLEPDELAAAPRLAFRCDLRRPDTATSCGSESGTLTRAKCSWPLVSREHDRQVQAQIRDVREGPAGVERQRRQNRENRLRCSRRPRLRVRARRAMRNRRSRCRCSRQRGQQLAAGSSRRSLYQLLDPRRARSTSCCVTVLPSMLRSGFRRSASA